MAKSYNQKLKLMYLAKIFEELSDEQHPMDVKQIIHALGIHGVAAERKSVYADIEALQSFGYDIIVTRGRVNRYYLGERKFQLPELKLLVDAAQSAKFITAKKSDELVRKIGELASKHQASLLKRYVYVQGRVRTMNESIYYNVDLIQSAINQNRKILFKYAEWALDPSSPRRFSQRQRRDGTLYSISPWALIWSSENYYLAGYDSSAAIVKHYRVDKLSGIVITDIPRDGEDVFSKIDMAGYTKRTFGMFGGEETLVTLNFSGRLIGVVVDRFGKDIVIYPQTDGSFTISVKAVVSPQFIAWVLGFGNEVKIISPDSVALQLLETLDKVKEIYKN